MICRILDTSVAVAWYLPEEFSKPARRWQQMLLDGKAEFYTPSLHYWEFANVLRAYVMRGEIEAATAHEIHNLHLDAPIISGPSVASMDKHGKHGHPERRDNAQWLNWADAN